VRWLYLETKKVRRALPVDACIRAVDAKARVEEYADKARRLDTITTVEDAEMNTGACGEYGGCYYHVSNGGPCNARRSIGGLIQARVPKKDTTRMALDPTAQNAFDKFKKTNGTGGAAASAPPAEQEAETREAIPGPQETPGELVKSSKPRTPRKASAPAGSMAERIAALTAELAQHEAEQAAAAANVARVVAAIREACG
jgi:hypothetical protein